MFCPFARNVFISFNQRSLPCPVFAQFLNLSVLKVNQHNPSQLLVPQNVWQSQITLIDSQLFNFKDRSFNHFTMQRAPLSTISGNRVRNTELNPCQRGMIMGARALGATEREIERVLNLSRTTIQYTIMKHSHRDNGKSNSRSGRPSKLSDRAKRYIINSARANPKITYEKLRSDAGVECSRTTIYRTLKVYGLTNWLAKKRPFLTEEVAKKGLDWCLTHREWTFEEWSKIIWSDECSVEKRSGKDRTWVFRFPNEKWSKNIIDPYPKRKGVTVMI